MIIFVSALLVLVMLMNCLRVCAVTTQYNVQASQLVKVRASALASLSQKYKEGVSINFAQAEGNAFLMDYYGVRYKEDKRHSSQFTCPSPLRSVLLLGGLGNSGALVCLSEEDERAVRVVVPNS